MIDVAGILEFAGADLQAPEGSQAHSLALVAREFALLRKAADDLQRKLPQDPISVPHYYELEALRDALTRCVCGRVPGARIPAWITNSKGGAHE